MSSQNRQSGKESLSVSVVVERDAHHVYECIKDVKAWWVGDVRGDAQEKGSTFTYQYKEFHTSTQKVTELVPNKKVVWHVEQAHLSFTQDKKEWEGTDLVFEIIPHGAKTEIKFTHRGLTPDVECYEACSGGWGFYISKSLKNLIEKGVGLDPGF